MVASFVPEGGLVMAFSPLSFVLGLGAAWVLPSISRFLRPLAVEAAAASLGMFDEGRRVIAEQMETLEDIAAEARARREAMNAAAGFDLNGSGDGDTPGEAEDSTPAARGRRRGEAAARRRVS
jgi:hypothetical protein